MRTVAIPGKQHVKKTVVESFLIGFYRIFIVYVSTESYRFLYDSVGLNRNLRTQSLRELAIPGKHSMSRRVLLNRFYRIL